ncbi:hypothetical protein [Ruegeria faecimaris]|uniref:hypothetical protein n=1 Tax=Ruegeria faecimaris TaxID=686389 RepID=UPI00232ECB5B|nr:hypothetical protein [Ruegeria faecimaris]
MATFIPFSAIGVCAPQFGQFKVFMLSSRAKKMKVQAVIGSGEYTSGAASPLLPEFKQNHLGGTEHAGGSVRGAVSPSNHLS